MTTSSVKPTLLMMSFTVLGGIAFQAPAQASFSLTDLSGGYALVGEEGNKDTEGKCGEGKCGEGKCGEQQSTEKAKEGKCGEGKCGEGKCGEQHDAEKAKEGKCGEGKCGEGKCGEEKKDDLQWS